MSLTPKRRLTAKKLAANRANGRRSEGAVSRAGKARAAAAFLRHGFYSQSTEVVLAALGEDPAEFERRLHSLIDTWEPANALEMGLVMRLARALWRMERLDRIEESLAVKHLERAREFKQRERVIFRVPLYHKMERLKALFAATCMNLDSGIGPQEMKLFEQCRGDLMEEKAKAVLELLLRMQELAGSEALRPVDAVQIPATEGEEYIAMYQELTGLLSSEIESLDRLVVESGEEPDEVRAQFDRDEILVGVEARTTLTARREELSLRQVWRITNLLMKIKAASAPAKKHQNDECSQ